MIELAIPVKETFEKSALSEMKFWFSEIPDGAAWYVVSDYCYEDKTKKNDVFSFSILLNHDKLKNIQEYINAFAPKDIKSTKNVSSGFLKYINSPVIFNVTFVVDRKTKLLKDYAKKENMEMFLPEFNDFVRMVDSYSSYKDGFIKSVLRRSYAFQASFKNKNFNAKISRKIYLLATFAGLIFHYLNKIKHPSHIAWISDRDALIERFDGFVYDLAYFMFVAEYYKEFPVTDNGTKIVLDKPQFFFPIPPKSGANEYDELIRIPDYLAGTLADLDIDANKFSKEKYYTILHRSLVNSNNHVIIHVQNSGLNLSTRRLAYRR
jgi:hypothetical protein